MSGDPVAGSESGLACRCGMPVNHVGLDLWHQGARDLVPVRFGPLTAVVIVIQKHAAGSE